MKLQEFIEFCKPLPNTMDDRERVYLVYYDDKELCEEIYAEAEGRLGVNLEETPEPMRASLEAIGLHYGVEILADW